MTVTVHLVRHAQGFHNLNVINQQIPDPYLTPLGKEQCLALRANFPYHDRITHLVASPMRRTLQTCELSFRPAVDKGLKVVAQPLLQELSTLPSDTGSEPEVLAAEFPWADVSGVPKGWNDKKSPGSPWAPRVEAIEERARKARVWLRELGRKWKAEGRGDDADIIVVTHGGFLHFLTQDWEFNDVTKGTGWENSEYRSYEFDEPEGDDSEASIHETKPSWRRRRGSAIGLTATEQQQLRTVLTEALQHEGEVLNGL